MIVTLCGSVRFVDEFVEAARELSRRGITPIGLQVQPGHRRDDEDWTDKGFDKVLADIVYFDKILHSDAVLVLGDGYIGFSTAREIVWAFMQEKNIVPRSAIGKDWDRSWYWLGSHRGYSSKMFERALTVLGRPAGAPGPQKA